MEKAELQGIIDGYRGLLEKKQLEIDRLNIEVDNLTNKLELVIALMKDEE